MEQTGKFLSRAEVMEFLNISEWKMKKLSSELVLYPDKVVFTRQGYKAYLYSIFNVVAVKRKLQKEGYKYKFA